VNTTYTTFCANCRLLQATSDSCRGCGQGKLLPLYADPSWLKRQEKPNPNKLWREKFKLKLEPRDPEASFFKGVLLPSVLYSGILYFIALLISGGSKSIALSLFVCAFTLLLLLGISCLDFNLWVIAYSLCFTRKMRFTPSSKLFEPSGTSRRGRVSCMNSLEKSFLGDEACLATSFFIKPKDSKGCYFRAERASEFLLTTDNNEVFLITGEVWVEARRPFHCQTTPDEINKLLVELVISRKFLTASMMAEEYLVREGDRVEVIGTIGAESRPGFADGYREGGMTPTFRGQPGGPVFVRVIDNAL
jgi:hypothetical protein